MLELPKAFLLAPGQSVLAGWTTASLPRQRTLKDPPSYALPAVEVGPYVQVSRLGMPLVNELVIGLSDKNAFNASHPSMDGQFLTYVTNPTLPELLQILFGVQAPNLFPRSDLVQVFLTGIPGLNANGSTAEMLRLDTATPPTAYAQQVPLGVLGGDLAGFPNGPATRRRRRRRGAARLHGRAAHPERRARRPVALHGRSVPRCELHGPDLPVPARPAPGLAELSGAGALLGAAALAFALLGGAAPAARAHDFWIEPDTFRPASGALIRARLFVGHPSDFEELPHRSARSVHWVLDDGAARTDLIGRDGALPAGYARPARRGVALVGYQSTPAFLELEPAKFASYLREEGLERALAEREALGESAKPGRELYARCAKALLCVDGGSEGWQRALGFDLELLPCADPFALAGPRAGEAGRLEPWTLALVFRGEPLADAQVRLTSLERPELALTGRTDARGRLTVELPARGRWLATSVYMLRIDGESRAADWQSFWASLTWEIPAAAD